MFLKQIPQRGGRVRLAVYESYRDGGRTRQRTVLPLGYLDELASEHEDPVAWGRSVARAMTEEREAAARPVQVEIHPLQKVDMRSPGARNLGCAAALAMYSALGVGEALRSASRGSGASYSLDRVMRLLVVDRIVDPGSRLSAWRRRGRYPFRSDFSLADAYRALDGIAAARDRVVSAMDRRIAAGCGRDLSAVYYDVTNYYFETDDGDGLRERGLSKEHRPSPIVQMGLLQDARGIPISYGLFPGNVPDCRTMPPVLREARRRAGLGRAVVVADKGLNTSANIVAAVARGDGFVISQSIRGTKSDAVLRRWVLDPAGYREGDDFRVKSRQGDKVVHLPASETASGRAEDHRVPVKYVAFWSGKYERRARAERAKVIERARDLVAHPGSYTRATGRGAAAYVRDLRFDERTGEVAEGCALSLDEGAIAEAEACDGYYLIVTSETGWGDGRVIDTYRELWRIEESFRVTKSEIEARPVFVWTPAHIEAHFLVCYVALVVLRLLQLATGLPCPRIREEIAALDYVPLDANWWVGSHRTEDSDRLLDALGLEELKLRNLRTSDMRAVLAKARRLGLPHA